MMNNVSLFLLRVFKLLQVGFLPFFLSSPISSLHVEENICSLKNKQKFAVIEGRPMVVLPLQPYFLCQAVGEPFI